MNQFRSSAIVHGVAGRSLVGSGDRGEAAEERGRQMLLNYENTLVGAIKEIDQLEGTTARAMAQTARAMARVAALERLVLLDDGGDLRGALDPRVLEVRGDDDD